MTGKYHGFGIVRDSNGKPRFDDIHNIHSNHWKMLSDNEKNVIRNERAAFHAQNAANANKPNNGE